MKKTLSIGISLFVLLTLSMLQVQAQYGPGSGGGNGGGNGGGYQGAGQGSGQPRPAIGHIFGKIVDEKTKKGIEFASVAIYKLRNDSLIGGQLTESNGEFSLTNMPFGGLKLKVTFVGYAPLEQQVIITPKTLEQDLGNIVLSEDNKTLNAVTVTAEKSTIEIRPDKKVFNVEKDLSSRGGTAADIMEKIPGVSVDGSGNVTLRNLTPIIYVDGKPTTLTMDQIPSDQIEKVEVITNPSAKYEADATGGIINVILKKNHTPGYNGIVTAAIGTNDQYNGSALINVREKKFGFMLNYNIHGSTSVTPGSTDRTNLGELGTPVDYINESDKFTLKRVFQTAKVGFDGYINNHNTLSLTQSGTFGNFKNNDNAVVNTNDSNSSLLKTQNLIDNQATAFRNFTTNLDLVHTYKKPDEQWTLAFSYNHTHAATTYLNEYALYTPQGNLIPYDTSNLLSQSQNGYTHADMLTAQWDFEDPINSNMKLEFGARSSISRQYSYLTVTNNIDSTISEISPTLSGTYRIDNMINAAYITFSHTVKSFSYQLGLRFEETYFDGTEYNVNSKQGDDSTFSYKYPTAHPSLANLLDCFFPSLMLSEKINDKNEIQFNVTRKINRPGFRQIAPFISNSTPYGYTVGNPALQPEFDNKAELNYDLTTSKVTWLSSIYGSYNQQPITQYTYLNAENSQEIVSSYENAKSSFTYGWENTFKIAPVKGLDIMLDGNVFYTDILIDTGLVPHDGTTQNSGISYVIKAIISYKLPWGLAAQVNGNYEAPKPVAQGHTLPLYWVDLSASKDFGIAVLTLAVSDVANTKIYSTYYSTPTYNETVTHRRDPRYARLGVTFKFGKMDASIFKKKKKDQNGPPNGDDLGF
jgi:outer membrane receptor protein involved in Fe transport